MHANILSWLTQPWNNRACRYGDHNWDYHPGTLSSLSSHQVTVSYLRFYHPITVTSLWTRWRLKSPASRWFTQPPFFFRRRSKKTSKLRVTGFVRGIHRSPVNSPHKWPVTRKMFPFDDVIMNIRRNLHRSYPIFKWLAVTWPNDRAPEKKYQHWHPGKATCYIIIFLNHRRYSSSVASAHVWLLYCQG